MRVFSWRARDGRFLVESERWEVSRGERGMGGFSWRARDGRFVVESERWEVSRREREIGGFSLDPFMLLSRER